MMRSIRRAIALTALVVAGAALQPAAPAHAATSRAVIVIGNSTYTVSFNGTITGLQALQMVASVETVGYGAGTAVCKINGVGNPAVPGQCLGETSGQYWSYWRSPPGSNGWTYSGRGAGSTTVSDGSVEGWAFGSGSPPPYRSFCDVAGCAPPPPPTTAPTTSAASPGGSSGSAASSGDDSTRGGDASSKGSAAASEDPSSSSASADDKGGGNEGSDDSESAADTPSGGRPNVAADDGDGLSTGTVAVAAAVVGLGGAGVVLRRRRMRLLR
ncbi:MAG: hypothetical protein FJW86_02075 [Actinobacteria bacterium]|nr:hypothetical protein [Actinomycetota bacterium]